MIDLKNKKLFFCAVGGSGMLPLALIAQAHGAKVCGSDRAYDQGRILDRFDYLKKNDITLYPQDGSGITSDIDNVIVSTAVEETVPDYKAAKEQNIPIITRAELLSSLFNKSEQAIGIAGTSGKSTVTGMAGWILSYQNSEPPTVINGATTKNFVTDDNPYASFQTGNEKTLVAEIDESDGSIARYNPAIAVINNIALDHKSMEELCNLFKSFAYRSKKIILNLDNSETAKLARQLPTEKYTTFSLTSENADFRANNPTYEAYETRFELVHKESEKTYPVKLPVPGQHNVSNALAALAAATEAGTPLNLAIEALSQFKGIARRYDVIGHKNGITVIDDFGHNPDKIAATLHTLHQTEGRVQLFFQPHGFGPLAMLRKELATCFADHMTSEDITYITDPLYLGGTAKKKVRSIDLVQDIQALGRQAHFVSTRETAMEAMVNAARAGDKIVIMGARDDSLTKFAHEILENISQ